jgi:hypothetical protein
MRLLATYKWVGLLVLLGCSCVKRTQLGTVDQETGAAINVQAQRETTLMVRIVDARSRKPCLFERVMIPSVRRGNLTNEEGVAAFVGLAPGGYEIVASPMFGYLRKTAHVRITAGKRSLITMRLKHPSGWKEVPVESLRVHGFDETREQDEEPPVPDLKIPFEPDSGGRP